MNNQSLSSPLARIAVFLWGIVFPIIFVALPLFHVVNGDREFHMSIVWAFLVWVLSPLVLKIALKYFGGGREVEE